MVLLAAAAGVVAGPPRVASRTVVPPALPPDNALSAALVAVAGEGFRTRETDHFTIAYDTSYEALRPLVGRLEGTYDAVWRFCSGHDLGVVPLGQRLQVILFGRFDDFEAYAAKFGLQARSVAGFYNHGSNIAAFCHTEANPDFQRITRLIETIGDRIRQLGERGRSRQARRQRDALQRQVSSFKHQRDAAVKNFNRFVIQHEAAHQMLFNLGIHARGAWNPPWLVEGLACQFEVPQTSGLGRLTSINHMRLADLRDALGMTAGEKSVSRAGYEKAIAAGRVVRLADLVSDPAVFRAAGAHGTDRYAQVWSVVYYLHRWHGEAFGAYLKLLMTRRGNDGTRRWADPGESSRRAMDAFESVFGKVDAAMERDWLTRIARLRLDPRRAGR